MESFCWSRIWEPVVEDMLTKVVKVINTEQRIITEKAIHGFEYLPRTYEAAALILELMISLLCGLSPLPLNQSTWVGTVGTNFENP